MPTEIKICGLSDEEGVDAALVAGADLVGFVFFAPSPRNVALSWAATLAKRIRGRARIVANTVDATDEELAAIAEALAPDLLQLHGRETPERVSEIRRLTGRSVMKAIGVAEAGDLDSVMEYSAVADRLLLDAKPPRGATRPGGNGAAFDWSILQGFAPEKPWFLSGGLNAANVVEAIAVSGAMGVDVSSGVEQAPGGKDPAQIRAFVAAVRAADAPPRRRAG